MPRRWRALGSRIAMAMRSVALLLLLPVLLSPASPSPENGLHAVVLIDRSSGERAAELRERIVQETGPRALVTLAAPVIDMRSSLSAALWEIQPGQQGAVIIASAGNWTGEEAVVLQSAHAAGVPVFWLPIAATAANTEIVAIHTTSTARPGQYIGVSVDFSLAGPDAVEIVLVAGRRTLARAVASESGKLDFQVQVPESGPFVIGAEVHDARSGLLIAAQRAGALVNVLDTPSVLVLSRTASAYATSLRMGGWKVSEIRASQFQGGSNRLQAFAVLVLDNVSVSDLSAGQWHDIDSAVRRDAMGLLVLGGAQSFSLGAYRGSQLETLLPVLSEPPAREKSAAVMFLVDVSGSMGRSGTIAPRLQMARQAVIETAEALRPIDRVGLMSFDITGRELLPLDARADHGRAISLAWPDQASGGTQLIASLQQAINTMRSDASEQKLLLLVTDGFLADDDIEALKDALQGTDIELIAMLIGAGEQQTDDSFEQALESVNARLVRVDNVLRLPILMRAEVESSRPAIVSGPVEPVAASLAAWLPDVSEWPAVDRYLVSTPIPTATIHLTSPQGDVLVASDTAGAGRVVAITFGLSGWATRWLQWARWPEFAADLVRYLAVRDSRALRLDVRPVSDTAARFTVEPGDTLPLHPASATLISPTAIATQVSLQPDGPTTLATELALHEFGEYTLVLDNGLSGSRFQFIHRPSRRAWNQQPPIAERLVATGLLRYWTPDSLQQLQSSRWRDYVTVIALLLFLASIILATSPARALARRYFRR